MKIAAKIKPIISCDGDSNQQECDFADICTEGGSMYMTCNHMHHTRVCTHPKVIKILTEGALMSTVPEREK